MSGTNQNSILLELNPQLLKLITCELSGCIFSDPVSGPEGTWERKAIQYELVKNKITSGIIDDKEEELYAHPITGKPMRGILIPNTNIKQLVEMILETNPNLKSKQFYNAKPYYLFDDEFKNLLIDNKFEELKTFLNIKVNDQVRDLDTYVSQLIFTCKDNELIKHLFRNSVDYNKMCKNSSSPLHEAAILSNPTIINFMINELKVDTNNRDLFKNLAIHYMCENQEITEELYDIVTDEKFSKEKNCLGLCPIHIVSKRNCSWKNLAPFIKKENLYHFEIVSNAGKYALHYISQYGDYESISKVIELDDINLDIETVVMESSLSESGYNNNSNNNTTFDDFIRLNNKLTKEQKRDLTLQYLQRRVQLKELKKKKESEERFKELCKLIKEKELIKSKIIDDEEPNEKKVENEPNESSDNSIAKDLNSDQEELESVYTDTDSEPEFETVFGDNHFDIDNITEDSSNCTNGSRIMEISNSSSESKVNTGNIKIYEDYFQNN